ncbi:hypothetical protein Egran_02026 [Elaphomyces granulatus]|uniref:Zinc finger PHD-type domain-containing protein n=1 Tax=Elaphomyces granulatus TaxID=519963 RepID=A0A232M1F3_9EURO|nr:hypothetical protein Egran_02026 [Elaphomyces granulatus]
MVSRKRAHSEMETPPEQRPQEPDLLKRLRDCWELANLMQYIFTFGKVMKIDEDFDIEDLETECLKPGPSEKLLDIGVSLLKFVSSHRGLTPQNFDEYTRRQYNAKAPNVPNPFGDEEEPRRFNDFDLFLKLRILYQLSVWTFWSPDRIREKMPEQKELEQTQWRIEELGYDREDHLYYVLDDNRLYRRTDPPIPPPIPPKPKANTKKARAAAKAAKRRKLSEAASAKDEDEEGRRDSPDDNSEDTSGGLRWECIAITLSEYQEFIDTLRKTKDPNEQILRDRLVSEVVPVIEKLEEAQQRKRAKQEKELHNMQLLARAKRSSRIAGKQERERQEKEAAEASQKQEADLAVARKEQEKHKKMEQERNYRMMTREQRIKDREQRRLLHEAELARMAEEQKKLEIGESRVSERHLRAEIERRKKTLEELAEEDQWIFDCCGCGIHGKNLDDGSHSVACEKCNVWQHSRCLGIPRYEAEKDNFHFVCDDCKRREDESKRPKIPPLKFRIGLSSSPPSPAKATLNGVNQQGAEKQTRLLKDITASNHTQDEPVNSPINPNLLISAQNPTDHQANGVRGVPNSPSPKLASQVAFNGSSSPLDGLLVAPKSPSKAANGLTLSPKSRRLTSQHPSQPSTQSSHHLGNPGTTSLASQRPSSSHSAHSPTSLSPIQNRPSMSPTQGNPDVGPLAGFPSSVFSNDSVPSTPFGARQVSQSFNSNIPSSSSFERRSSFSAMTTSVNNSFSHPLSAPGSQNIPFSGLSPTKQSPRAVSTGSIRSMSVIPPVQKLVPSPKLMGRSSPDAPIPAPVKSMTLKQEGCRQLENEVMARTEVPHCLQTPTSRPPLAAPPLSLNLPEATHHQPPSQPVQDAVQTAQGINGH